MYFHKIDHPANFSFVSTKKNPFPIGKRSFDFRVADLGDDVHRLEVRSRIWKGSGSLAGLDDTAFLDGGLKTAGDVAGNPSRAAAVAGGARRRSRIASARTTLTVGERAGIELSAGSRLALRSKEGRSFGVLGRKWIFCFELDPQMRFYGMGEKSGPFEKSGIKTLFWNTDAFSDFSMHEIEHGAPDPLYAAIPYLLIKQPQGCVGLLVDNPFPVFMNTGSEFGPETPRAEDRHERELFLGSTDGTPVLYFIYGESGEEVAMKLQRLCGTVPLPPLWALGHQQCRWGYRSFDDLEEVDRKYREHEIPNDGLWLDIDYMKGYRVFTVDDEGFAGAKERIAELASRGRHVVPILDPGVKLEPGYPIYDEGEAKGVFCRNSENRSYVGFAWPGQVVFPDFSLAAAREWWARKVEELTGLGFAGYWLDMNDPSTGASPLEEMRFDNGKNGHESFHNQYALGMQMATLAGVLAAAPNLRPFLISRSASLGTSRYSAVWMGDNVSNYHHLAQSISMALNLSMSGIPFVGADVPGFAEDADAGIAAAWYKAAFLFPFLRNHSSTSSKRQEPWQFGGRVAKIIGHYIALRYKLLPYLYNLFIDQAEEGRPILRPMFYEPEPSADLDLVDDQFMVGPVIMQAPVVSEHHNSRKVRLPDAKWWSAWDRRWLKGGREITAVESAKSTPIYFKEGAIVPMQVGARVTNENKLSEIELHLFVSERYEGISTYLYRYDDGATFGYRDGQRSSVQFTVSREKRNVIVDAKCIDRGFGPLTVTFVVYGYFGSIILKRSEKDDELEALTLRAAPWYLAGTKVTPHASEPVTIG